MFDAMAHMITQNFLLGATQCVVDRDNPKLGAVSANQTDLWNTYVTIDAMRIRGRWCEPWASSSKCQMISFRSAPRESGITLHQL